MSTDFPREKEILDLYKKSPEEFTRALESYSPYAIIIGLLIDEINNFTLDEVIDFMSKILKVSSTQPNFSQIHYL